MMKLVTRTKTLVVMLLAMAMLFSVAACGNGGAPGSTPSADTQSVPSGSSEAAAGIDISEEVALTMYLIGDPPTDYDEMLGLLNAKMKEDINATLEVRWLSWSDWRERYTLLLSSGESFDLIFTANWAYYTQEANKGAFYNLDGLLETYMPQTFADMPDSAWEQARLNDGVYMVPMNYREANTLGYVVRGDLRKKYNIGEIKTLEDFGAYLQAIKENEPELIPYNAGSFDLGYWNLYFNSVMEHDRMPMTCFGSKIHDPSGKTYNVQDTPEYLEFIKTMREWYEAGYWSKDVLMNETSSRDAMVNGTGGASMLNLLNFNEMYISVKDTHPEWELEWFDATAGIDKPAQLYVNNGMAVNANSKNPERALMLLDLLHKDQAYFNLTTYGIEGKNYVVDEGGRLATPEGVTSDSNGFPPDSACPWGWREQAYYMTYAQSWPGLEAMNEAVMANQVDSKFATFTFDDTAVKNEIANVTNVRQQYEQPLIWGLVDPEQGLAEYRQQMESAGINTILAELQTQVDAFLAA